MFKHLYDHRNNMIQIIFAMVPSGHCASQFGRQLETKQRPETLTRLTKPLNIDFFHKEFLMDHNKCQ